MFGVLHQELLNTVKPLQEYWTPFIGIIVTRINSTSICEFMTEVEPFALDECPETVEGSVVRIEHYFSQCYKLRCSIPSIATMN